MRWIRVRRSPASGARGPPGSALPASTPSPVRPLAGSGGAAASSRGRCRPRRQWRDRRRDADGQPAADARQVMQRSCLPRSSRRSAPLARRLPDTRASSMARQHLTVCQSRLSVRQGREIGPSPRCGNLRWNRPHSQFRFHVGPGIRGAGEGGQETAMLMLRESADHDTPRRRRVRAASVRPREARHDSNRARLSDGRRRAAALLAGPPVRKAGGSLDPRRGPAEPDRAARAPGAGRRRGLPRSAHPGLAADSPTASPFLN